MPNVARVALACRVLLLVTIAACDGGSTAPGVPVEEVTLTGAPTENVVLVGGTVQLTATPRDAAGAPLSRTVTWASTNAAVARVSNSGLVTAVAAGVAVITAEAGGESGGVAIDVRVAVPVPAAGAGAPVTTTLLDNALQLTLPPGATTATALTVGRGLILTNDTRLLTASSFVIGPAGVTFSAPATVELTVNLASVAASKRAGVRLFRVTTETGAEPILASSVDVGRGVVLAPLQRGGTYVAAVPGDVASVAATEGNSRRVPVDSSVPGVSIIARDAAGHPVPGVSVVFAVEGGTGRIVGDSSAVTGTDGVAVLRGRWLVGSTNGRYALRARIVGAPFSVLFEATAFTPATAVAIRGAPVTGRSGVRFTEPFIVELVGPNGVRAEVTQEVTLRLIGAVGTLRGTTVETAVLGGAIFQGQQIDGPGTFRVIASSPGLAPDTSDAIAITQEVAALTLVTAPAGAASGVPFTTQPVIELRDAAGLRVVGGTAPVIASLLGSGTLFGTRTVAAVDGRATFTSLAVEGQGSVQLVFSAFGASNVLSGDLVVASAPPGVRLLVGVTPFRDATPNQIFGVPVTIDLANRAGANVRSLDVTVTWDPARFSLFGQIDGTWRDSTNTPASVTIDASQAAQGRVQFTGTSPGATTTTFQLGLLQLQTLPLAVSTLETTVTATVSTATNATGAAVPVRVLPMTVQVTRP